jgi:dolichol-phosphate mannosyltransferase
MVINSNADRLPRLYQLIEWLKGFRYVKFGLVGASGTVVNMVILFVAQEYLLAFIEVARSRLYASLALAIAIATVNNFTWNRLWTWADRLREAAATAEPDQVSKPHAYLLLAQFGRYTLASWIGIALQYGLTIWLSQALHYLLANVIAIVIASVSNFLANDHWTFRRRQPQNRT